MATSDSPQLQHTVFATDINRNHQHLACLPSHSQSNQNKIDFLQPSQSFSSNSYGSVTNSLVMATADLKTFQPSSISTSDHYTSIMPSKNSLTPPSPTDSGVVDDSKSDQGNTSQDALQNFDESSQEEPANVLTYNDNPYSVTNTIPSATLPALSEQCAIDFKDCLTDLPSTKLQQLIYSKSNPQSSTIQLPSSNNNCVPISEELAAIWSPPTVAADSCVTPSVIDQVLFSSLQQQQQLSSDWSISHSSTATRPINPPPGLDTVPNLQKKLLEHSLLAARINNSRPRMPLRRSQSAMFNRQTLLTCAIPSDISSDDLTSSGRSLEEPISFSPWMNETTITPTSNISADTQLGFKQFKGGSTINAKSVLAHQQLMTSPPKFHRSISTPASHSSPLNISALLPSLDDNPFTKSLFLPSQNGQHYNLGYDSNALDLSALESKLSDILSSNNSALQQTHFHQPHRVLGKWKELSNETIYEESHFTPSFPVASAGHLGDLTCERFSRKVFVGGLPPDIAEDEIRLTFLRFGRLVVDWPHKTESKSYFPPKGYAFLLFEDEISVHNLVRSCYKDREKLYIAVSSPTTREKPVQIRPWRIADSDYVLDRAHSLDPRKTVFVGGVPRPLRAFELAVLMDRFYGGVCYAGIDVDPDLKYPKGAGRVAFSNEFSYKAAISDRYVHLQLGDIDKRVEVKPYVLDDQHCDECHGARCSGKFAPFFCANLACLRYYCEQCWILVHSKPGYEGHKPMVKEGAERFAKSMFSRW